jgi:uncharacterized membrane protein YGL010W
MDNIVYASTDALEFYNQYHQNFINKLIHAFCIPMIVLSMRILTNNILLFIQDAPIYRNIIPFSLGRILSSIYVLYYFTYGWVPGLVMCSYFTAIEFTNLYIQRNIDKKYFVAWCLFCFGWTMQFIGHGIEGRKPALVDSVGQAFTGAPIFSMQFFYPSLLK